MASEISGYVQKMMWSFAVQEYFCLKSRSNETIVVLAGSVLSGTQDDPIGRSVRIFVRGLESGQGKIVSRYRFDGLSPMQSAYVFEGDSINRDDIHNEIVLMTEISKDQVDTT